MKIQLKVITLLAAALAVVFFSASVPLAFSSPGELAYCRMIDSGLSFECDPVSNLAVVNSNGVIPVTGFALPSFTTSLRSINVLFVIAPDLSLSDFALANPAAVATSLRGVNNFTPSATELILADFVANPSATELILADFVANPSVVATSLRAINEVALVAGSLSLSDTALTLQAKDSMMMKALPKAFYFGSR